MHARKGMSRLSKPAKANDILDRIIATKREESRRRAGDDAAGRVAAAAFATAQPAHA